jgi:glycosyltransferase involved in cell wall biosynthesis
VDYIVALRVDKASANHPESAAQPAIALLPWGDVVHDFLGPLGLTLDDFATEFTGSWMFGYVEALKTAGVKTVIVCPTTAVRRTTRSVHRPTGAPLVFLPPPRGFASLRRLALVGRLDGRRDPVSVGRAVAAHVAPYLATPPHRLARVLRDERCTAVLCQEYEHPRFDVCVAIGRRVGVPVFATFQGGDEQHSRLERLSRRRALHRCGGLIIAPDAEAERVRRRYDLPPERIARLMNPVDLRIWREGDRARGRTALGLPGDALVVAWHGQVQILRKGLDVLLDAWRSLTDARSDADLHLVLAGSGEDVAELRRTVAAGRLRGVRLPIGWIHDRSDLADVLAAADVYAFPSRHEGLPVAPLEALAAGVPVVASDAPGVADAIGDAGAVVPVGNASALAASLGALLDDPALRAELARRARPHVEARFSLEAVGSALRRFMLPETRD